MRIIIGYGNPLRGEDAFGIDVLRALEKKKLKDTKLLELFELTPELVLKLLDANKLVFIDASYSAEYSYTLATPLHIETSSHLSHHISPLVIVSALKTLYAKELEFEIFSMMTSEFEQIKNHKKYQSKVQTLATFLGLD